MWCVWCVCVSNVLHVHDLPHCLTLLPHLLTSHLLPPSSLPHLTPSPSPSLTYSLTSLSHLLTPSPPHSFTSSLPHLSLTSPSPLPHPLTGQPLGEVEMCLGDVVYSPELHGFSVVMGDGKAVFISAKSAKYEPQVKYILFMHALEC